MREILFRGKTIQGNRRDPYTGEFIDIGTWVEGFFVNCASMYDDPEKDRVPEIIEYNADRQYQGEYSSLDAYEVDPETVSQYTGLTDKNGRKIFEGDIIESLLTRVGISGVRIVIRDIRRFGRIASYVSDYEVVGNVWDNPELLEDKE